MPDRTTHPGRTGAAPSLRIGKGLADAHFFAVEDLDALLPYIEAEAVPGGGGVDVAISRIHLESSIGVDEVRVEGLREIRTRPGPELDLSGVAVLLPLHGGFTTHGGPWPVVSSAGDGVVIDRSTPWRFTCDGDLRLVRASVPFDLLPARLVTAVSGRCLHLPGSPLLSSFAELLRSAVERRGERCAASSRIAKVVEQLTTELLEDAIGEGAATRADLWRLRMTVHVDQHLRDPDLDARGIALAMGISVRYVHQLFAADGITAARFIEGRRLEAVAGALRCDPAVVTPGELADRFGFGTTDRLGRAFRRRYGLSVSDYLQGSDRYRL